MAKKIKDKGKILTLIGVITITVICVLTVYGEQLYYKIMVPPTPTVKKISITEDNKLSVKFSVEEYKKYKEIYCLFNTTGETPKENDTGWTLAKNHECTIVLDDNIYYAFLKNHDNEITEVKQTSEYGKVLTFEANKEKVYVAKNGTYSLTSKLEKIGNIDTKVKWTSADESIATIDENGKIKGVKAGTTKITATIENTTDEVEVMVTDLIVPMPKNFNNNKSYLSCGKYSEAQNDLLDAILKDRIEDAGYKTRAGVVAAARFLALEFPYKIRYFSENGRETTNGVQGEGRYYNVGLYLHKSRFVNIKKPMMGKATWGCSLYSRPSKGYRSNGVDCSGYITWVLLNGGFDVKDVGAGVSAGVLDLTDYGKKTRFTDEVKNSGKIKIGDLLSSEGPAGGHIAMIVGEDDNYYYVTESLWTPPNVSVTIIAYPKTSAIKKKTGSTRAVVNDRYYWVMLMDDYYKEDGNLTKHWAY